MAGGRERILRRRIKSIQSTQKITRAMELIAASRIARAGGRRRGAALQRDHHPGGARPRGRRRHERQRLAQPTRRDPQGRVHRGGGRPRPVRCVQLDRDPHRRTVDRGAAGPRSRLLARARRPEGGELLPIPRLQRRCLRSPASHSSRRSRTHARSAPPRPRCSSPATPISSRSCTCGSSAQVSRPSCGSGSCR